MEKPEIIKEIEFFVYHNIPKSSSEDTYIVLVTKDELEQVEKFKHEMFSMAVRPSGEFANCILFAGIWFRFELKDQRFIPKHQ